MRARRGPVVDPKAEEKKLVNTMLSRATVSFETSFIDEPDLLFTNGNTSPDCRAGLREFGAWQTGQRGGSDVTMGVVGTGNGLTAFLNYLDKTRTTINPGLNKKKRPYDPVVFPEFPGWDKGHAYGRAFDCPDHFRKQILQEQFVSAIKHGTVEASVKAIVELVTREVAGIAAYDPAPRVVVVVLPQQVEDALRFVGVQSRNQALPDTPAEKAKKKEERETKKTGQVFMEFSPFDNAEVPTRETENYWNLHHALKAHTMSLGIPLQVVWESTLRGEGLRQDPASTAWNFMTALFYKAGNIPWQPVGLPADTCYIGVSFYRVGQGKGAEIHTSFAQVFGAREGLVMKGDRAVVDETKGDRSPHLTESGAEKLIKGAVELYTQNAGAKPKRVVVHKTSRYWPEELKAFRRALEGIPQTDLLALERMGIRFFRMGDKPPIRGTVLQLTAKRFLVFTGGYIPFLRAYPGFRVPHPVDVLEHHGESPVGLLAKEIMILTKLNWNSCAFASSEPITIRFARSVGTILTSLPAGLEPQAKYRYYM